MAHQSDLRADCPACGTVEVRVDHADLVLGFEHEAAQPVLRFVCPSCGRECAGEISERATRLLMAAGIGVVGSATTSPISPDVPGAR